jgi:hypothetical protein
VIIISMFNFRRKSTANKCQPCQNIFKTSPWSGLQNTETYGSIPTELEHLSSVVHLYNILVDQKHLHRQTVLWILPVVSENWIMCTTLPLMSAEHIWWRCKDHISLYLLPGDSSTNSYLPMFSLPSVRVPSHDLYVVM